MNSRELIKKFVIAVVIALVLMVSGAYVLNAGSCPSPTAPNIVFEHKYTSSNETLSIAHNIGPRITGPENPWLDAIDDLWKPCDNQDVQTKNVTIRQVSNGIEQREILWVGKNKEAKQSFPLRQGDKITINRINKSDRIEVVWYTMEGKHQTLYEIESASNPE